MLAAVAAGTTVVRADETEITGPDSFRDGSRTVCSVQGSTPSENIRQDLAHEADGRYDEAWEATAGQFDQEPITPPTVDRY